MLEFFNFYIHTHTKLIYQFFTLGLAAEESWTHHIFPIFFLLLNLSLIIKLLLAGVSTKYQQPELDIKQRIWQGYFDIIAIDLLQAFCFWQFFETIDLGEWVTLTLRLYGLAPIITLFILMLYQAMTLKTSRTSEERNIAKYARWFLILLSIAGVIIMLLKSIQITTFQDWFHLFKK